MIYSKSMLVIYKSGGKGACSAGRQGAGKSGKPEDLWVADPRRAADRRRSLCLPTH